MCAGEGIGMVGPAPKAAFSHIPQMTTRYSHRNYLQSGGGGQQETHVKSLPAPTAVLLNASLYHYTHTGVKHNYTVHQKEQKCVSMMRNILVSAHVTRQGWAATSSVPIS